MTRQFWVAVSFLATGVVPATAMAVASAELYGTQPYLYGRFEARIQYAPGDGVVSTFFLWKEGSELAGTFWNELDFEKVAADCHMTTNARFGLPSVNHSQNLAISGAICAEYHDYAFEWTPTYIAWIVDGQELRRDIGATATAFSDNASGGMTFHFNLWPGNANFGGNFSPAILPVHQYISWVQYSSFANDAFQLQWREDFQGGSLPAGWATGNFPSPFNLSIHSPDNVGIVGGIAVLSMTADDGTGAPGVPPVDPTDTSGAGTAGADASDGGEDGAADSQSGSTGCSCQMTRGSVGLFGPALVGLLLSVLARRRRRSSGAGIFR